ncbi:hypothetical protein AGMMS50255_4320 [Spirochaetia bacterium]|nr:hypothetical protein AGMMS50255_4320 [Spirochaetia bacterium]
MGSVQTIRLELRSPLFYRMDSELIPFQYEIQAGEILFCFDLDPVQSRSIEPESAALLGPLVFAGRVEKQAAQQDNNHQRLELPAGKYLFAQERREGNGLRRGGNGLRDALNRQEFIEMAIEVQKDGLWERLTPADRLYARYLFEDERTVTQVFRPY